ncbi:MAG: hypothetical protein AAGG08_10135, partial [Actinomycetota bacterium]
SGGSTDSAATTTSPATSAGPAPTPAATRPVDDEPDEPVVSFEDGPLADVCPARIVIQTGTLPLMRLGPLYALVGAAPEVDGGGRSVTGRLTRPTGEVEDVELEVRTGGPAISFRSPLDVLRTDPSVHVGVVGLADLAIGSAESATPGDGVGEGDGDGFEDGRAVVTVAALAPSNDAAVIWDPAARPDIATLDDVATSGIEVRHVAGEPAVEFLVTRGHLDPDQMVAGGGSGLAAFVTGAGQVARVGDALADPPLFRSLPEWGRPVAVGPLVDAGWADVDPVVVVRRPSTREVGRSGPDPEGPATGALVEWCLGRLVPVIQASIDAYLGEPGPTNELMATVRGLVDPLDRTTGALFDAAAAGAAEQDWPAGVGVIDQGAAAAFLVELADAVAPADLTVSDVDALIDPRFWDVAASGAGET